MPVETVLARKRVVNAQELVAAITEMVLSPSEFAGEVILIEDAPLTVELVQKPLTDGTPVYDLRIYRSRS